MLRYLGAFAACLLCSAAFAQAPTITVTPTSASSLHVAWSPTGADHYTLQYRWSNVSAPWFADPSLDTTGTSLDIPGMLTGQAYDIEIGAVATAGAAADASAVWSATVTGTPAALVSTAPVVVATNVPSVVLTWTAPTSNSDGSALTPPVTYNVYQGTAKIASGLSALTYTVGNLAAGTYSWAVTATGPGGEGGASPSVGATIVAPPTPLPGVPGTPTLACSNPSGSKLVCSLFPGK